MGTSKHAFRQKQQTQSPGEEARLQAEAADLEPWRGGEALLPPPSTPEQQEVIKNMML